MSTYKKINGQTVQSLSSDPPSPFIGQLWYNSTSGNLKFNGGNLSSVWSSKNAMPAFFYAGASAGTLTSIIAFGGTEGPANSYSWDGTNWTSAPALPSFTPRTAGNAGAGASNTSAISVGNTNNSGPNGPGNNNAATWDGSSWTAIPNMNVGRSYGGCVGTTTNAIAFGGYNNPPYQLPTQVEKWDSSSWTTLGIQITPTSGKAEFMYCGTTTAALMIGGSDSSSPGTQTAEWTGQSWSVIPAVLGDGGKVGGASGTSTLAICGNGEDRQNAVEGYNGTAWTSLAASSSQKGNAANNIGPNNTETIMFGGGSNSGVTTEQLSSTGGVININYK